MEDVILQQSSGICATVIDDGEIAITVLDSGEEAIQQSSGVCATILDSGELNMTVSFDNKGDLDVILATLLLDEAGNPILDMQGQYIIGGNIA